MLTNIANSDKKPGVIETTLEDIDNILHLLHTGVARLEDKLNPVVISFAPANAEKTPTPEGVCPMHQSLIVKHEALKRLVYRLEDLESRICV